MNDDTPSSTAPERFTVVMNHEEQYAIWPVGKDLPANWRATGVTGTREECLAHVRRVWTDMRPLSNRKRRPPPSQSQ